MQAQIDNLNIISNDEKERNRKKNNEKETEIKTLELNVLNLKSEKDFIQNELKQIKARFENLKTKEKENQFNFEKTLNDLEKENETLSNKFADVNASLNNCEKKYESTKSQLTKYEQLIDSLNEKVILLKREYKENHINLRKASHSLEIEIEAKTKLDIKCQQLEKNLNSNQEALAKYENYEKNLTTIQVKYKQMQSSLITK